ncbi:MAG: hypothetical protein LBL00_06825 [Endomicrobium sp.]|jgi:hypothetical protein|nr:hypothetical protein [Endomicrobium sp.]
MEKEKTYKALTNNLLLFGFQLGDLALTLAVVVLAMGFSNSPIAAGVVLLFCLIFFRKMRGRTAGYFKAFYNFIITPDKMSVKDDDIKSYKETIKCRK